MANLPISANPELDQIFGGSDDEENNLIFPLANPTPAADLLDENFLTRQEEKESTNLLMDVLVQRPQFLSKEADGGDDLEKMERDGIGTEERTGMDSLAKDENASRKYSLRDRHLVRKRPPAKALEEVPRKVVKEDEEEDSFGKESPGGANSEGEGEDDSSEGEEDSDDSTLYCLCRQPHGGRFMICCDNCEDWFHGSCVGITVTEGKRMEKQGIDYVCPHCLENVKKKKLMEEREEKQKRVEIRDQQRQDRIKKLVNQKITESQKSPKKSSNGKPLEKKRDSSTSEQRKPSTESKPSGKKIKDFNGERKSKLDRLAEDRRRFLVGDSLPSKSSMKTCIAKGCNQLVLPPTLYCSDECIQRYSAEAINTLLEYGVSFHGGINVIDTATGKVIMYATSRTNLVPFLRLHRSYMVHLPSGPNPKRLQRKESTEVKGEKKVEKAKVKQDLGTPSPSDKKELSEKKDASNKPAKNPKELRLQAKKALYMALLKRVQESEDCTKLKTAELEKLGVEIEEQLFNIHQDVNTKYKARYRTLLFNLKDERNTLFRKVVAKEITPCDLVKMNHDELASEELKRQREQELKKNLEAIQEREKELNKANSAIRKITKKGEEEIESEFTETNTAEVEQPKHVPVAELPGQDNTTAEHGKHLFDANCDICQGKVVRAVSAQQSLSTDTVTQDSEEQSLELSPTNERLTPPESLELGDDYEALSPTVAANKQTTPLVTDNSPPPPPPRSTKQADLRNMARKSLAIIIKDRRKDIRELMNLDSLSIEDLANSIELSLYQKCNGADMEYKQLYRHILSHFKEKSTDYLIKQVALGELTADKLVSLTPVQMCAPVWSGQVHQPGLANFNACARHVAGHCQDLEEMLPSTLNVVGRIGFKEVWPYLEKIKLAQNKSVSVLCFEWLNEERSAYMSLLDYLVGRQRIGVVDVHKSRLKDLYLVPVLTGEELPRPLQDIGGPGLGQQHEDLLLGVIVRSTTRSHQPHPPVRHTHKHGHHRRESNKEKESLSAKVEDKQCSDLRVEVGFGKTTPPLPGEGVLLLPNAKNADTAVTRTESEGKGITPTIKMYGSVEGKSEPEEKPDTPHNQDESPFDDPKNDDEGSPLEQAPIQLGKEEALTDSSLSPSSSYAEDVAMDTNSPTPMDVNDESAYSPSAPLEEEEQKGCLENDLTHENEPYSPSSSNIDQTEVEAPQNPVTQPSQPDSVSTQTTSGAFNLLSSLITSTLKPISTAAASPALIPPSSTQTQPSSSSVTSSWHSTAAEPSSQSAVSNSQLQNLLSKLPILAQTILGSHPSDTKQSPSVLKAGKGDTPSPTSTPNQTTSSQFSEPAWHGADPRQRRQ